jgi:hypothetical protein
MAHITVRPFSVAAEMTEASRGATRYDQAREAVPNSLHEPSKKLHDHLGGPFKYRFVSQAQAAPFERSYFLWFNPEGREGDPFSSRRQSGLRYTDQAAAARQLEAFLQVTRVSAFRTCQAAIRGFEGKEIAVPYMKLRSLIERIANVTLLAEALKGLPQAIPPPDQPSKPLIGGRTQSYRAIMKAARRDCMEPQRS